MGKLNHFDNAGEAIMVDVGQKNETARMAVAKGRIRMQSETLKLVMSGSVKKGDVLGVARVAGIMATKQTSSLIPLCHPISLEHASVSFEIHEDTSEIEAICTTQTTSKTGVEMEALTGVTAALLTIYDMCKASDRAMEIHDVCVHLKTGGKSGEYRRD